VTTLAEEQTLLARLVQSGRCAVDEVGLSVQGRPVRLLRVGIPPPAASARAALLHVGGQHGNEPAPREALLEWAQALVDAGPYLALTGTSGDYASTPHTGVLGITGDLDLRAECAVADWGAAIQTLVGKYVTASNQRAYRLTTTTPSGLLRLYWSTDGTAFQTRDSTVAISTVAANGTRVALRATLDVDNGNTEHTVRFWWAPYIDVSEWTQLGDPVVTAGTTSVFNATSAPLELGSSGGSGGAGTTNLWAGRLWAAEVRDGIDGTVVASPRLQDETLVAGSWVDSAGRTWTVNGSAAIASILTQDELDFLASTGVLLIPTMNPDGVNADTRENAAGTDLNRDHIDLSEPETRALAAVQQAAKPAVTFDQHETTLTRNEGHDLTFMPTTSIASVGGMVDAGIVDLTDDILTALRARCTAETWDDGDWVTVGDERRLTRMAWLRHSAAIVVETTGLGTSPQPLQDRIDQHRAMAEEALAFCAAIDVIAVADTSIANATAAGAAGTAPFNIRTEVIDPPPRAYRMTGLVPNLHLELHGISHVGGVISMAQAGYPAIPFLWDPSAQFAPFVGVRLFALPSTVAVATVQQLAPIVAGSHDPVFEARAVAEFTTGLDPDGADLPILAGSVVLDGTADVERTLDLTTVGQVFPRRRGDTLLPDGTEVFVRRGVDIGPETLWVPLGYFRIESAGQPDAPDGEIRLVGYDRMKAIIDSQLIRPRQFRATRTFGYVFANLVGDVFPQAAIQFDDDLESEPIGRPLIVERSRYEPLRTLALGRGKIMHWDGAGLLQVRSAPDPAVPIWEVKAGRGGVLSTAQREVTRSDVVNAVVVRSQGGDTLVPARAVAVDDGPQSITRFGGRFGEVPEFVTLPAESTAQQVATAARDILLRRAGLPYRVEVAAVPNPAVVPYDPIRVTLRDGTRERHVTQRLTIPLTARAPMPIATREQRNSKVVIL
jgi:hypothetical protein